MKIRILYLIILFSFGCINTIKAQNYYPKGAIWHFNLPSMSSAGFSVETLESKGDTIFNGDTLTYIEGSLSCGDGYNELIKQVGGEIYTIDTTDSSYNLLYDFGAQVGDTITIRIKYWQTPQIDSMIYVIDSIIPITINATIRNVFYISYLSSSQGLYDIGSEIIEGIGGVNSFYPMYGACDPVGGPLRCYEDSIIGFYRSPGYTGGCDSIYVGIDEFSTKAQINILPNPFHNVFTISSDNPIQKVQFYDIRGVMVLETKRQAIDVSSLSVGMYILKVQFEEGIITQKVIKE